MEDAEIVGVKVKIPARTLGKLKQLLENRDRIQQALGAANEVIGSVIGALIDQAGGKSENLDDYIINIEHATITEKVVQPAASDQDIEP